MVLKTSEEYSLYRICEGKNRCVNVFKRELDPDEQEVVRPSIQSEEDIESCHEPMDAVQKEAVIAPDEYLMRRWGFEPNELVHMESEEIERQTGEALPDTETLKAIHAYVLDRIEKSDVDREGYKFEMITPQNNLDKYLNFMDETALLALGKILEVWIEEYALDADCWQTFMEPTEESARNEEAEEGDDDGDEEEEEYEESSSSGGE